MIVVDVGCAAWGEEVSIPKLVERFKPTLLYGFDPAPASAVIGEYQLGPTWVRTERKAAWIYNGVIGFSGEGTRGVVGLESGRLVECFDLARFLNVVGERVILKLDVEGAEFTLLRHLRDHAALGWVDRLLVEWHGKPKAARSLTNSLRATGMLVEEWE